jgi:hypothetical protein
MSEKPTTPKLPAYTGKPRRERDPADTLTTAGIILSVVIPIVGFVIGVVLLIKNRVGAGIACLVISVLAGVVWAALLTGAFSTPTADQSERDPFIECIMEADTPEEVREC